MRIYCVIFACILLAAASFGQNCTAPTKPVITAGPTTTQLSPTSQRIDWTTDVPSSSFVAYGWDANSYGNGWPGNTWVSQDTVTGVTSHSVILTGLNPGTLYGYGVRSNCFSGGVPDSTNVAAVTKPTGTQLGFTFRTQTYTIDAANLSYSLIVPVPDQPSLAGLTVHSPAGFHAHPGYGFVLMFYAFKLVAPSGYSLGDGSGMQATLSGPLWTGGYIGNGYVGNGQASGTTVAWNGSTGTYTFSVYTDASAATPPQGWGFDIRPNANTPTSGAACTAAGGENLGANGCAYWTTLTLHKADANCGGSLTCTDPAPVSFYIYVWDTPTVSTATPSTLFPACTTSVRTNCVPCVETAAAGASYDACLYADSTSSYNGNYYSWKGQLGETVAAGKAWGRFYGANTSVTNGQQSYFYSGDYAMHIASGVFSDPATWDPLEQNVAHIYRDNQVYKVPLDDSNIVQTVTASSGSLSANATCDTIRPSSAYLCKNYVIDCGGNSCNLGTLQAGIAAGYIYSSVLTMSCNGGTATTYTTKVISSTGTTFTIENEPGCAIVGNSITSLSESGNTVTAVTRYTHGMVVGQRFFITGASPSGYNGTFTVLSVVDTKTFTYTNSTSGLGAGVTGTLTLDVGGLSVSFKREASNIPAQATSNATTIVFPADFDLTNVTVSSASTPVVAYVLQSAATPTFSKSITRGATVAGVNNTTHTVTLSGSGISDLTTGSLIQIRKWAGMTSPPGIYVWPKDMVSLWNRTGDYIMLDAARQMAAQNLPLVFAYSDYQREVSLKIDACRQVNSTSATASAIGISTDCSDSGRRSILLDQMQTMFDLQVNTSDGGGWFNFEPFMSGVQAWSLLNCVRDATSSGCSTDPRWIYWVKALADHEAPYFNARTYYYEEWPYMLSHVPAGFDLSSGGVITVGGVGRAAMHSEEALWSPVYAFYYAYTGDAAIPNFGGRHYSDFFNEVFRYGVSYAQADFCCHGKTLGQTYLWTGGDSANKGALEWMATGTIGDLPTVSPASIAFTPDQQVGTSSDPQTVTLVNASGSALTIASIAFTGAGTEFTKSTTCPISPSTLAAGLFCTVTVRFAPTTAAAASDTLRFTHDGSNSPQDVSLGGTGIDTPDAPTASLSCAPAFVQYGASFTCTPTTSNATSCQYSVDGGTAVDMADCGTPFIIAEVIGTHTIKISATGAGGSAPSNTVSVYVQQKVAGVAY